MRKVLFLLLFTIPLILNAQNVELNRVNAKEEFMWGVKFFNQGLYEKSVFSFEKSLSYDSTDNITHLWLGKAYYMKGALQAALKEWDIVKEAKESPLWLDNTIDIVNSEIGVINTLYTPGELVTHYKKEFIRPSSILPLEDGSSFVVSFLNNRISRVNINGAILETFNGGVEEFNRPYDIVKLDNNFIVSEFMGDRVSIVNDLGIKTGEYIPKDYKFAGPSYMAMDNWNYLYVSDWGNKRVVKFDKDGNHVLSIGGDYLKGPTGVAAFNSRVFVSDQLAGVVLEFDISGNFKSILIDGLDSPEGLSIVDGNSLYIADGNILKEYLFSTKEVKLISDLEGKGNRITKAVKDINGNILVSDFNLNSYYSLTDLNTLYSGLFVTIDRINSINYPQIQVELNVMDRLGNPVVGLDNTNFLVSEGSRVLPQRDVTYRGSDNKDVSLSIILDFDKDLDNFFTGYYDTIETIINDSNFEDDINLIKAGELPTLLSDGGEILNTLSKSANDFSGDRCSIDLALKLASSTLMKSSKRREIILITDDKIKNSDFNKYSLDEISSSLKNNRISLTVLYLTRDSNDELDFIIEKSGGTSRYLFSGKGAKGLFDTYRKKLSGYYIITYDSLSDAIPGETFIPVEAEVNYIRKSGRSESGYFSPLKITK